MAKQTHNREQRHPFETVPPHQHKYERQDDNWGLKTTACPVDTEKVSSNRGDANVAANLNASEFMHPIYAEGQTYAIHQQRASTDHHGRNRK